MWGGSFLYWVGDLVIKEFLSGDALPTGVLVFVGWLVFCLKNKKRKGEIK